MIYDYNIENLKKYSGDNFFLIAGPCVIESEELVFHVAEKIMILLIDYQFHTFSKLLTEKPTGRKQIPLRE
jgi:3-deoxy-D-manno-octulosonic acid (KDO) 8-phosphate synthase